jgi:hypothetical protein
LGSIRVGLDMGNSKELNLEKLELTYIDSRGLLCPFCETDRLEGGPITVSEGRAFQKVTCECGAEWTDGYELSGMHDIQEPVDE